MLTPHLRTRLLSCVSLRSVPVFFIAAQAALSCHLDTDGSDTRGPGETAVRLSGRLLAASELLGLPMEVAVVDSHLMIIDMTSDSTLHFVNRRTGHVVKSAGRRGAGPREFQSPWSLDVDQRRDGVVRIYDLRLRRITEVQLRKSGPVVAPAVGHSFQLSAGAALTGPVAMADDRIMGLGLFQNGRVAVFDHLGQSVEVFGALPPGPPDVPAQVRQHAYQATLVPHPARSRFVAFPRHASSLEFFASDGTSLGSVDGPVVIEPDFNFAVARSSRGFVMNPEAQFGYIDGTASEEHIFGLFSGRSTKMFKKRAVFGQLVHVWDWDGNFQVTLDLQTDAIGIAVDQQSLTLYSISHDPQPSIYEYSLADVLGTTNAEPVVR